MIAHSPTLECEPDQEPATLKVATFNCGKKGVHRRLADIFSPTHPALHDADVILLQECHPPFAVALEDRAELALLLGEHYRPHYQAIISRDGGILFLTLKARPVQAATGSRWAYARASVKTLGTGSAATTVIDFWSVHGTHHDPSFWQEDFGPALLSKSGGADARCDVIVGADWNALPDPMRDSLFNTPASCAWSAVAPALAPLNLADAYRSLRPEGRDFTRTVVSAGNAVISAKRLDSIWVSPRLLPLACAPRFGPTSSDHYAAATSFQLSLAHPSAPARSWKPWSLHPGTLRNAGFRHALQQFGNEFPPPPSEATPAVSLELWQIFHTRLRSATLLASLDAAAHRRRTHKSLIDLETTVGALDLTDSAQRRRLPALLDALRAARLAAADAADLLSTADAPAGVFRPTSWLAANHLRTGGAEIPLLSHTPEHPSTKSGPETVCAVHTFYSNLFTPEPAGPERDTAAAQLLSPYSRRLDAAALVALNAPINPDDVVASLRQARPSSAPGTDGLPYRLLTLLADKCAQYLASLATELCAGAPLAVALRTTLLFKKGLRSSLVNYRPITVADTFLRTLTRVVARRLQTAAGRMLPWTQAAFLPERRTSTLVAALQGIIDHLHSPAAPGPSSIFLVFLDQQKAYDRVDRHWLVRSLRAIGCPESVLNFISSVYSGPTTQIMVNGAPTEPVPLFSGVLQGDPLSYVLYNIALQPLLDSLKRGGAGVTFSGFGRLPCLAFANDIVLLIPGGPSGLQQWQHTSDALSEYELASGARLNRQKSGFYEVVGPGGSPDLSLRSILLSNGLQPLNPANNEITHLGYPLQLAGPPSACPVAFIQRLDAIGTRIGQLRSFGSDLLTRARLCNSLLTPMLWHSTAIGGLPTNAGQQVRRALYPFLYLQGQRPWLSQETASKPRALGGLGLIDPDAMFTAQSISFLGHHIARRDEYGAWLREGLTRTLRDIYQSPPAALLIPDSALRKKLASLKTRQSGLWGLLLHALASVPLALDPEWLHLPTDALLELPWFMPGSPSALRCAWPRNKILGCINAGWVTWSDILWNHTGTSSNQPMSSLWPLGPPAGDAVPTNFRPRGSGPPPPRGPGIGRMFGDFWSAVDLGVRIRLRASTSGDFHEDRSDAAPLAVPRVVSDAQVRAFPWHLLRIGDRAITGIRVRTVRALLSGTSPAVPVGYEHDERDSAYWSRAWLELRDSPTPSEITSAVQLWMHRRAWLAIGPQGPLPCVFGCDASESQAHAFIPCPIVSSLWRASAPILHAFGVSDETPLDARLAALAWPAISSRRAPLVLWRNAVVHTLIAMRHPLVALVRDTGHPQPPVIDAKRFVKAVCKTIFAGVHHVWSRGRDRDTSDATADPQAFQSVWLQDSTLISLSPGSDSHLVLTLPAT